MQIELSKKQLEFVRNCNTKTWNGKIGATQCGKTTLDIMWTIPNRIVERRGFEGINVILGVSKGTITRNIITPLQNKWGTNLVTNINSENTCRIFGELVYCLGAEKVSQVAKIRGAVIKYLYWDEMVDCNEEVFMLIQSRLSKSYSVADFTGNPSDPSSFVKKFIDKSNNVYCQHWTIYDNPFLPREYIKRLEEDYSGTVYYNRYILGEWARAEGLIYKKFANNNEDYIIDEIPKNIVFITIGVDFGGNGSKHAFTATGFTRFFQDVIVLESETHDGEIDPDELDELYTEFTDMIINKYGKATETFADSAEQVLIRGLRNASAKLGLRNEVRNAKKMQIKSRISIVNRLISQKRFHVYRNAKTVINALNTAVYDKDNPGERLDNGTSDIDTMDSLEYGIERYYKELIDVLNGNGGY